MSCVSSRINSFGHHEGLAHLVVEPAGHVSGHLQVLQLVFAYGHKIRIVQQNVRGHQHGVREQAPVHVLQPIRLVLETVGERQALVREKAIQVPREFGHFCDIALAVEDRSLGVEAKREPGSGHRVGIFPQRRSVLDLRQGVHIGDEQERLVFRLVSEVNGGPNGAEQVAQMGGACALYAGEDACHARQIYSGSGFTRNASA